MWAAIVPHPLFPRLFHSSYGSDCQHTRRGSLAVLGRDRNCQSIDSSSALGDSSRNALGNSARRASVYDFGKATRSASEKVVFDVLIEHLLLEHGNHSPFGNFK